MNFVRCFAFEFWSALLDANPIENHKPSATQLDVQHTSGKILCEMVYSDTYLYVPFCRKKGLYIFFYVICMMNHSA